MLHDPDPYLSQHFLPFADTADVCMLVIESHAPTFKFERIHVHGVVGYLALTTDEGKGRCSLRSLVR